MKNNYNRTIIGCYLGIFVQAIVNNFTAILFVPLMGMYDMSFVDLGILVSVNFVAQVGVDILFSGAIDKYGYRRLLMPALVMAFVGLFLYVLTPNILPGYEFFGFLVSTVIFAAAPGFLEIKLSSIVNDVPSDNKGAAMSLMHSFYAWGQLATVALTTIGLFVLGKENWQFIIAFWMIFPLITFILFCFSPLPEVSGSEKSGNNKLKVILSPFFIIAMLTIFTGASAELVAAQWCSSFLEKALGLSKTMGDLIGICGFAAMMGTARALYGALGSKVNIHIAMMVCSAVSFVCYVLLSVSSNNIICLIACALAGFGAGILWPGTLVIASDKFPTAGAWIFAILAAAGDIGGSVSTWFTGIIIDYCANTPIANLVGSLTNSDGTGAAMRLSLLIAALAPLVCFFCNVILRNNMKKSVK